MRTHYRVIVGNIGTVYDGLNEEEARHCFIKYIEQSKSNRGRAGGESVFLIKRQPQRNTYDEDLIAEHIGVNDACS